MVLRTSLDLDARFTTEGEPETGYTQLFEIRDGTDPLRANPTQFQIVGSGAVDREVDPKAACRA